MQVIHHDDVHLSYLPLAHMFERLVHVSPISSYLKEKKNQLHIHLGFLSCDLQLMMVQHGARIGFSRGDVRLLTEDLQALKPTIFPTVPRLVNRIYDKVVDNDISFNLLFGTGFCSLPFILAGPYGCIRQQN